MWPASPVLVSFLVAHHVCPGSFVRKNHRAVWALGLFDWARVLADGGVERSPVLLVFVITLSWVLLLVYCSVVVVWKIVLYNHRIYFRTFIAVSARTTERISLESPPRTVIMMRYTLLALFALAASLASAQQDQNPADLVRQLPTCAVRSHRHRHRRFFTLSTI